MASGINRLRQRYPDLAGRVRAVEDLLRLPPEAAKAALAALDKWFRVHENRLFASEGASGGSKWAPLSPKYAKRKRRRAPGRKILQLRGRLRRSLVEAQGAEHIARVRSIGSTTVLEVGTSVEHAVFHQSGTAFMPRRNPVQMTPTQETEMKRQVGAAMKPHVERAIVALLRSKLTLGR